jgi:hypothetical protein
LSKDQFARLFDLALDFAEEDRCCPRGGRPVKAIAEEEGAVAKVSSIHVNVWMGKYDKLSMAERFLSDRFGWDPAADRRRSYSWGTPPTTSLCSPAPLRLAVANIRRYGGLVKRLPAFVSRSECGEGFAEIAAALLARRSS